MYKGEYRIERGQFDCWAAWRERGMTIPLKRDNLLAKMMKFGILVSPVNYDIAMELGGYDDLSPLVDVYMHNLKLAEPTIYKCLDARHRQVIVRNDGEDEILVRRYKQGRQWYWTDQELAYLLFKWRGHAGRMRFQRYCEDGYERFRGFALHTPKDFEITA